jgi:hypothetical protein
MQSTDSPWAWIPQVYPLGFRFTFAEGRDAGEMIAACGVDPEAAQMLTLRKALEEYEDDYSFFRTGETAGWGFLLEQLDGEDRSERLHELSVGRRGVLVTWVEVKGRAGLDRYEDGRHTGSVWTAERQEDFAAPEAVLVNPTLDQVRLSPEALRQRAWTRVVAETLDLLTAEYGIRLDREQVEGPLLTGEAEIDMSWLDDPRPGST